MNTDLSLIEVSKDTWYAQSSSPSSICLIAIKIFWPFSFFSSSSAVMASSRYFRYSRSTQLLKAISLVLYLPATRFLKNLVIGLAFSPSFVLMIEMNSGNSISPDLSSSTCSTNSTTYCTVSTRPSPIKGLLISSMPIDPVPSSSKL